MNKFRKEKYIKQIYNPESKHWSFQVRYKGQSKFFSEKDYVSPSNAFRKAVAFRNSLLSENVIGILDSRTYVDDCFEMSFKVIPVREETQRKLRHYYHKYVSTGSKRIKELTTLDIVTDLNNMIEIASNDTIQRVLTIYKRIIRTAILKEYIYKDVTIGVIPPKSHLIAKKKRNKLISRETLLELENVAKSHIRNDYEKKLYVNVLETLWFTGMRPCELVALEKDDIDFRKGTISITKEIGSSIDDYLVVRQCKTELSNRTIPIHDDLKPVLKEQMDLAKGSLLFEDKNGSFLDTTLMGNKIHLLGMKYMGISFNMYMLRHSFSERLMGKADPRTHQELMGHATYTTSVNYGQSSMKEKKEALKNI